MDEKSFGAVIPNRWLINRWMDCWTLCELLIRVMDGVKLHVQWVGFIEEEHKKKPLYLKFQDTRIHTYIPRSRQLFQSGT